MWRLLRHKLPPDDNRPDDVTSRQRFLVFAPSIGSKPTTGINGGFSSNIAFFRGDPRTTRISVLSAGVKLSQKKQTLSGIKYSACPRTPRAYFVPVLIRYDPSSNRSRYSP